MRLLALLALLAWALLPGCRAVTGPDEVRGLLGDSLSITCTYEPGQEEYPKFWCTPSRIPFKTCGKELVITSEWKPEAQNDRYSIRDNHTLRAFTVTVNNLSKEDEGIFFCGVEDGYFLNDKRAVKVIVYSASSTLPSSTCTTTTFSDLTLSVTGHTQTVSQGEIVQSTSNPSTPQVLNMVEHVLIPAVIVVLFLLVVAAGVLVVLSRKKKKALFSTDIEMDRTRSISPTQDAGALNYAHINHGTGGAASPYCNAGAVLPLETPPMEYTEVRQSAQPLEDKREALYSEVQKPVPRQEQIYANVPAAPRPSEELYGTVWGT